MAPRGRTAHRLRWPATATPTGGPSHRRRIRNGPGLGRRFPVHGPPRATGLGSRRICAAALDRSSVSGNPGIFRADGPEDRHAGFDRRDCAAALVPQALLPLMPQHHCAAAGPRRLAHEAVAATLPRVWWSARRRSCPSGSRVRPLEQLRERRSRRTSRHRDRRLATSGQAQSDNSDWADAVRGRVPVVNRSGGIADATGRHRLVEVVVCHRRRRCSQRGAFAAVRMHVAAVVGIWRRRTVTVPGRSFRLPGYRSSDRGSRIGRMPRVQCRSPSVRAYQVSSPRCRRCSLEKLRQGSVS